MFGKKYYFVLVYKNKVIEIDKLRKTYFICDKERWFIEYFKPYKNSYEILDRINYYER